MAQMMLPMMIAGTVLQAGGQVMAGREQARAAAYEQQQLQIQSDMARTRAAQVEAQRAQELEAQIGTIAAIRGGRNVGQFSPTGTAIFEGVTEEKEKQGRTERVNALVQADQYARGAEMAGMRRSAAPWLTLANVGGTIAGGLTRAGRTGLL